MVDRKHRDLLADAIHELIIGHITTDQFDNRLAKYRMNPTASPDLWSDSAIGPLTERAWCLYDDRNEYRMVGANKLNRESRAEVLRWILFLRSDAEYRWPPFRFINPFFLPTSAIGCLLSLLTLGMWGRKESSRSFKEWMQAGEFAAWPFRDRLEYERAYSESCPPQRVHAA
jgi:hypothetical protein